MSMATTKSLSTFMTSDFRARVERLDKRLTKKIDLMVRASKLPNL